MKCKIDGCNRCATYKKQQVCQMHYFRFMRNGTYDTVNSRNYRYSNQAGYQLLNEPDHPLVQANGYVYEHRFIYFNQVDNNPTECKLCGVEINWKTLHIDHVDDDVTNNKKYNLRALCRSCNVFRGHSPVSMGKTFLTINGVTLSPSAWARVDGVEVVGQTIARRKKHGMSDYDAVFSKRITHHKTKSKQRACKTDGLTGIGESIKSFIK
jgi:hypothetical protein